MANVKIAVIVGSNRRASINRKLAHALAQLGADSANFSFVEINDLPLYNQDLEADMPPAVVRFKAEIAAADGVLFVTPEYNRSIPAVLKSAIDWGTRPYGKNSWAGKSAAIAGASPGAKGAAAAHQHLRQIFDIIGVSVMGGEANITFKPGLVDEAGHISNEGSRASLKRFVDQLVSLVATSSASDRETPQGKMG